QHIDASECAPLDQQTPIPPPKGEGGRTQASLRSLRKLGCVGAAKAAGWGQEVTTLLPPPGSLRSPPSPLGGGISAPATSARRARWPHRGGGARPRSPGARGSPYPRECSRRPRGGCAPRAIPALWRNGW